MSRKPGDDDKKPASATTSGEKVKQSGTMQPGNGWHLAAKPYDLLVFSSLLFQGESYEAISQMLLGLEKENTQSINKFRDNLIKFVREYGGTEAYNCVPVFMKSDYLTIAYTLIHLIESVPYFNHTLYNGHCKSEQPTFDENDIPQTYPSGHEELDKRACCLQRLLDKEGLQRVMLHVVENGTEAVPMLDKDRGFLLQKFKKIIENARRTEQTAVGPVKYISLLQRKPNPQELVDEYENMTEVKFVTFPEKHLLASHKDCDWTKLHARWKPAASKIKIGSTVLPRNFEDYRERHMNPTGSPLISEEKLQKLRQQSQTSADRTNASNDKMSVPSTSSGNGEQPPRREKKSLTSKGQETSSKTKKRSHSSSTSEAETQAPKKKKIKDKGRRAYYIDREDHSTDSETRAATEDDETKRASSRTHQGKFSRDRMASDLFASAAISSPTNVTKRKTTAAELIASTGPLPSAPSAHEVKDKVEVNVPKANPVPATNGTTLPLKRSTVTPGTARKRVGGEGRTASLQRILRELPNLCDPNVFPDVLLKTYGCRLEASKVFECLATRDLKEAVMKKFSVSELMAMIQTSDGVDGKLLTVASTEAILQEVLAREELRKSDKLLSVLLQNVDGKKALNNENVIGTVLHVASDDAIVKELNARSSLKSSEKLINTLLQKLPEKISDETKKSVIKVLNEKFNTSELVDISHAAMKMSVDKYQKQ